MQNLLFMPVPILYKIFTSMPLFFFTKSSTVCKKLNTIYRKFINDKNLAFSYIPIGYRHIYAHVREVKFKKMADIYIRIMASPFTEKKIRRKYGKLMLEAEKKYICSENELGPCLLADTYEYKLCVLKSHAVPDNCTYDELLLTIFIGPSNRLY